MRVPHIGASRKLRVQPVDGEYRLSCHPPEPGSVLSGRARSGGHSGRAFPRPASAPNGPRLEAMDHLLTDREA